MSLHKLLLALALAAPLGTYGFHAVRRNLMPRIRMSPSLMSTVSNENVEQVTATESEYGSYTTQYQWQRVLRLK
jgi:hypothetical protein